MTQQDKLTQAVEAAQIVAELAFLDGPTVSKSLEVRLRNVAYVLEDRLLSGDIKLTPSKLQAHAFLSMSQGQELKLVDKYLGEVLA